MTTTDHSNNDYSNNEHGAPTEPTVINTKEASFAEEPLSLAVSLHPSCRAYYPISHKSFQLDVHMGIIDFISDRRQF